MDSETVAIETSIFAVIVLVVLAILRVVRESECSTKAGSTKVHFSLKKKNRDGEGKPGVFQLDITDGSKKPDGV